MKSPTSEIQHADMHDFPTILSFYVTPIYRYIDANYGSAARRCTQGLGPSTAYSEPVVQTDPLHRTVGEVAAQSGAKSTESDTTLATAE